MHIGLGDISDHDHLTICIYIANRPPLPFYQDISNVHAIQDGEIAEIGKLTGNHWRKIFNVYAKLIYEFIGKAKHNLPNHPGLSVYFEQINHCSTWQEYRDTYLLKNGSNMGLLFSQPDTKAKKTLHIIMGKSYAESLGYYYQQPYLLSDINDDFACYDDKALILCPYFDYRQLSNQKITALVEIMLNLLQSTTQLRSD